MPPIAHSSTCGSEERRKAATSSHSGWRQLQQDQRVHALGMVECQLSGTAPPLEWAATWTRSSPRWSRSAAASAASSPMLTGGGVCVLRDPAPLVVSDQPVPLGQRRFFEERQEPSARTRLMSRTGS